MKSRNDEEQFAIRSKFQNDGWIYTGKLLGRDHTILNHFRNYPLQKPAMKAAPWKRQCPPLLDVTIYGCHPQMGPSDKWDSTSTNIN